MYDDDRDAELEELRKTVERQRETLDLMSEALLRLGFDPLDPLDAA